MAMAYFDASALVPLVVDEATSAPVATLWDEAAVRLTSRLGHVEVCAALAAAARAGRLSARDAVRSRATWQTYWEAMAPVELTSSVADRAADLAATYGLRGADSVHLASALEVGDVVMVVSDVRLHHAATAAGLVVASPE